MAQILLIEDDKFSQNYISKLIAEMGHEVLNTEQVAQGLSILNRRTVDLIVLDYGIPVLDGLDMVKLMKKLDFNTPVIVYTGLASKEDVKQLQQMGVTDVVYKSEPISNLLSRIELRLSTMPQAEV